ncbi:MAG: RnfABCDGE type electron transport complex subunit A [Spirochaetaceae bacterium]|jgi:electron transport complex protein RnfA|nr:RnfABCDGE type electron transport complex subunit A [Spirochaetaceae bacterium]
MSLFNIFIKAALIDNIVLMGFLALCSFVGMTNDEEKAFGMSVAVTFVTVMANLVAWPIYIYILKPLNLTFLSILAFILVIASLVQLVEFFLRKKIPPLYNAMGIYLPLITTNCAVLAVTLNSIQWGYTYIEAIVYAVGVSVGYMLAMILLAGLRRRIRNSPIPNFLKGTPILFVATALMSMVFMGFSGLVK